MDPGKLAQILVKKHWTKFGSIRKLCTYQSVGDTVHDPSAETITPVILSSESIYIIFDSYSARSIDGDSIQAIDKKALFPFLNIVVTPKINDLVVDESGQSWQVRDTGNDPVPALYELQVRPVAS